MGVILMNDETIYLAQRIKRYALASVSMLLFISSMLAFSMITDVGVIIGVAFGLMSVYVLWNTDKELKIEGKMRNYFLNKQPIKTIEW
jgi:hypothetical protein